MRSVRTQFFSALGFGLLVILASNLVLVSCGGAGKNAESVEETQNQNVNQAGDDDDDREKKNRSSDQDDDDDREKKNRSSDQDDDDDDDKDNKEGGDKD